MLSTMYTGKTKKPKGKKMNLAEFQGDSANSDGFVKKNINWADECMEDDVPGEFDC